MGQVYSFEFWFLTHLFSFFPISFSLFVAVISLDSFLATASWKTLKKVFFFFYKRWQVAKRPDFSLIFPVKSDRFLCVTLAQFKKSIPSITPQLRKTTKNNCLGADVAKTNVETYFPYQWTLRKRYKN